jgi:hypothetical protein
VTAVWQVVVATKVSPGRLQSPETQVLMPIDPGRSGNVRNVFGSVVILVQIDGARLTTPSLHRRQYTRKRDRQK